MRNRRGKSRLLTGPQACERLGVSRATLLKLIKSGEIPAMKLGPSKQAHLRIPEDGVVVFNETATTETTAS